MKSFKLQFYDVFLSRPSSSIRAETSYLEMREGKKDCPARILCKFFLKIPLLSLQACIMLTLLQLGRDRGHWFGMATILLSWPQMPIACIYDHDQIFMLSRAKTWCSKVCCWFFERVTQFESPCIGSAGLSYLLYGRIIAESDFGADEAITTRATGEHQV